MTVPQQEQSKIKSIVRASKLISRMLNSRPEAPKSSHLYYQMLTSYFTRILEAKEKGDFIVAHTVFFPAEIFYSMGIVPMHTETTTWMISLFTGECSDLLEEPSWVWLQKFAPHTGDSPVHLHEECSPVPMPSAGLIWYATTPPRAVS
jgi:hypothetical protein